MTRKGDKIINFRLVTAKPNIMSNTNFNFGTDREPNWYKITSIKSIRPVQVKNKQPYGPPVVWKFEIIGRCKSLRVH
jgi:hypothetical protein